MGRVFPGERLLTLRLLQGEVRVHPYSDGPLVRAEVDDEGQQGAR